MHEYKLSKIKKVIIDPEIIKRFKVEDDFTKLSLDIMIEVGSYICVAANIFPAKNKSMGFKLGNSRWTFSQTLQTNICDA